MIRFHQLFRIHIFPCPVYSFHQQSTGRIFVPVPVIGPWSIMWNITQILFEL